MRFKKGMMVVAVGRFTRRAFTDEPVEVVAVPGDPEYDRKGFIDADDGFVYRIEPGSCKAVWDLEQDWAFGLQRNFAPVEDTNDH